MRIFLRSLITIAVIITVFSCNAEPSCSTNLFDKINVEESLRGADLQKPYLLDVLGVVEGKENCFLIYYYEKEFGNKRLTQRLVIIPSKGDSFGLYAIPEKPSGIKDTSIYFKFQEEDGNHIELNVLDLPKSIYLDSELYDLDLYKKITKR